MTEVPMPPYFRRSNTNSTKEKIFFKIRCSPLSDLRDLHGEKGFRQMAPPWGWPPENLRANGKNFQI